MENSGSPTTVVGPRAATKSDGTNEVLWGILRRLERLEYQVGHLQSRSRAQSRRKKHYGDRERSVPYDE